MSRKLRILTEGAICVALAVALSYVDVRVGGQGGSMSFVMVPIIVFAVRSGGLGWGVLAGSALGILKFFLAGGVALGWQSMLLDYVVAYAAVGLAGLFRGRLGVAGYGVGALVGSLGRFLIHFVSGVTIYAQWAEKTYLGVNTPNAAVYSLVYNGFYMVFNTIAAIILCPALAIAINKVLPKRN